MNRFTLFKASIRSPEHNFCITAFFTRRPTKEEFRAALREEYPEVNGVNLITQELLTRLEAGQYTVDEEQGYWDNR